MKWLFKLLSKEKQKEFAVWALDYILKSKTNTIDQNMAIRLIEKIAASRGNKVTAFLMKEE